MQYSLWLLRIISVLTIMVTPSLFATSPELIDDGLNDAYPFNTDAWSTRIASPNYIDWTDDKVTISTSNSSSSIPKSTLLFGPYLDYGYEDEEVVVWFTLPEIKVSCSEARNSTLPPFSGRGLIHSCPKQVRFSADLVQDFGKHKLTKTPIITVKLRCSGIGNPFGPRNCVGSYGPVSLISSKAKGAAKTEFRIFLKDKLHTPEFDNGLKSYGNITVQLIGPIRYQFNNKVEVE